jgi:hypothetical protein
MNARTSLLCAVLALAPALPCSAETRLVLGGDYVFNDIGLFELMLNADVQLARGISAGGRAGALLATGPVVGVPTDLFLRVTPGRVYFEGLIGPWFFFTNPEPVRLHGGFGFGLQTRRMNAGLEVGGLSDGGAMIGLRFAFRI